MGQLTKEQHAFLWGYALERGHLKLGAYHEMADEHGADRVATMLLAVRVMKEMSDDLVKAELDALPPPPPWPFKKDPAEILAEIRNAKTEANSSQADR